MEQGSCTVESRGKPLQWGSGARECAASENLLHGAAADEGSRARQGDACDGVIAGSGIHAPENRAVKGRDWRAHEARSGVRGREDALPWVENEVKKDEPGSL